MEGLWSTAAKAELVARRSSGCALVGEQAEGRWPQILELRGNWPAGGAGAFRAAGVRTYRREARWIEAREELEPSARVWSAGQRRGSSLGPRRRWSGSALASGKGGVLGWGSSRPTVGKEVGAVGWWVRIRRVFPLIATRIAALYGRPVVES
jgi:hypothetical protein